MMRVVTVFRTKVRVTCLLRREGPVYHADVKGHSYPCHLVVHQDVDVVTYPNSPGVLHDLTVGVLSVELGNHGLNSIVTVDAHLGAARFALANMVSERVKGTVIASGARAECRSRDVDMQEQRNGYAELLGWVSYWSSFQPRKNMSTTSK